MISAHTLISTERVVKKFLLLKVLNGALLETTDKSWRWTKGTAGTRGTSWLNGDVIVLVINVSYERK